MSDYQRITRSQSCCHGQLRHFIARTLNHSSVRSGRLISREPLLWRGWGFGPPKQQREDDWSSHPMYRRGKTVFRINKSGITSVTLAAVASQRRFTVMNGFRLGAGSGTRLHWPQARTGWNFATSLWSFPLMALWIFPNDLMEVMRWKVAAFGSLILFDTKTIKFTN